MMVHATFSTYRWRCLDDCWQQKRQSDAYHLLKSSAKSSVASCMNESPGERRFQSPVQSYNRKWWKWPTSWYKLHTHTTCFTRHRSQPTTGTRNTDTHDRHTTDKFLLLFFNRQYWWAAQTKRLNERDTAQNKGKMEEAPACVDKQRKTTNPCPNRNYY